MPEIQLLSANIDSNDLPYDALSYTWGPATADEARTDSLQIFTTVQRCYPILCQGRVALVTKSLRRAITAMEGAVGKEIFRGEARKTLKKYIWADGLCVNQDDASERSDQVALMCEIYRRASLVFVWLGEADTVEAVEGIQMTLKLARIAFQAQQEPELMMRMRDDDLWRKLNTRQPSMAQWRS